MHGHTLFLCAALLLIAKAAFAKPHSKPIETVFDSPILEAMSGPNKELRTTFNSPTKTAVTEAVITDSDKEISVMVQFQHDESEFYCKLGVSVEGDLSKPTYKPLIECHTLSDIIKTKGNRKPDYHIEGKVVVERTGDTHKFTFDEVKLVSPNNPTIRVYGYLARAGKQYHIDVKVTSSQYYLEAKGSIETTREKIYLEAQLKTNIDDNLNFKIKYDMDRFSNNKITYSKENNLEPSSLKRIKRDHKANIRGCYTGATAFAATNGLATFVLPNPITAGAAAISGLIAAVCGIVDVNT